MDRLDWMQTFVRVAETGSFSAAARALGVGQPAVSKQIAALEEHLGAQLLRRTSRGLNLTESGREFYTASVRLLGDLVAAESRVGHGQATPSGLLRVALSAGFGRLHVVPLLPAFFGRYPRLTIDFQVSDRRVNLIEEGIDLAVRIGELSDSTLIARRVATTRVVAVATPEYLARRGVPSTPEDVEQHDCVVFSQGGTPAQWPFTGPSAKTTAYPKGLVRSNDAEFIRGSVLAGLGLGYTPSWLFAAELASGAVKAVLKDHTRATYPISAVYPGGRRPPRKVFAFIDFLASAFKADPNLAIR